MNAFAKPESNQLAVTAPRQQFDLSPQNFEQALTFSYLDSLETPDYAALAVLRHWLMEFLDYDQSTGLFTWNSSPAPQFPIGTQAGSVNSKGYIVIRCHGRLYLAHRLAWLLTYGKWPAGDIDHINGNRADNRITNLRDVTRSVNQQNLKSARRDNATKHLGVKRANSGRFEARINLHGRYVHLGTFPTAAEAHAAYLTTKRNHHEGCTI